MKYFKRLLAILVLAAVAFLFIVSIIDNVSRHEARAQAPAGYVQDIPSPRPSTGD